MTAPTKIRALIVDDSSFMRHLLTGMLERSDEIEIAAAAKDGDEGIELAQQLKPDVVTMDVLMRGTGGIEALRQIVARPGAPAVIMVSAVTTKDARATIEALEIGAVDFIPKPPPGAGAAEIGAFGDELVRKVRIFGQSSEPRTEETMPPAKAAIRKPSACVAIGTSTGGPIALTRLLPNLPSGFPAPLVIAQHMPPGFTSALAERLNAICAFEVCEGTNGMALVPGRAIVAPSGKNARLWKDGEAVRLALEATEQGALSPSIDTLFASLAAVFGERGSGVLLTGMGDDGVEGLRALRAAGGLCIGQDRASSVVYGMPRAAAQAGVLNAVASLDDLPRLLCQVTGLGVPLQRQEGSRPPHPET